MGNAERIDFHVHLKKGDALISERALVKKLEKEGLNIILLEHNSLPEVNHPQIICAEEVSANCCDIIAVNIQEEIERGDANSVLDSIKEQGGIAILAHLGRYLDLSKDLLKKFDAIEAINGRTRMKQNILAFVRAVELGIPVVGGSDAHFLQEVGNVVTLGDFDAINEGKFVVRDIQLNRLSTFSERLGSHVLSVLRNPKKFPKKVRLLWKKMSGF